MSLIPLFIHVAGSPRALAARTADRTGRLRAAHPGPRAPPKREQRAHLPAAALSGSPHALGQPRVPVGTCKAPVTVRAQGLQGCLQADARAGLLGS